MCEKCEKSCKILENFFRVVTAHRDPAVTRVHRVQTEPPGHEENLDCRVHRDHQDPRVRRDRGESRVYLDPGDHVERLAHPAHQVGKNFTVQMSKEVSKMHCAKDAAQWCKTLRLNHRNLEKLNGQLTIDFSLRPNLDQKKNSRKHKTARKHLQKKS